MSSGPENRFIQALHRILPVGVYRMKNHNQYIGGIPDCWYSGNKGDLWVEYKHLLLSSRPSTIIDLVGGNDPKISALQQEWLRCRDQEGRNVGVIIGTPLGGVWFAGTSWSTPLTTAEFHARLVSKRELSDLITSICSDPYLT